MKVWLIAVMIVLAFMAVDITVRIGWDRLISGIGSLVDGQQHAEQVSPGTAQPRGTPPQQKPLPPALVPALTPEGKQRPESPALAETKQPAEVKTPRLPAQPVPGALPWPGEQELRADTPVGGDGIPASGMPLSRRGPVSGPAIPIANLPSGWQGEYLESPRAQAYCAVWRDGPDPSRLLYVIRLHTSGYIQLILPYTPDIVLIGLALVSGDLKLYQYRQFENG